MKSFSEIIAESKRRQFAFLLNGVQANILLLVLELAERDGIVQAFGGEFSDGVKEVLSEVRERIGSAIEDHRFITLYDLQKLADQLNRDGSGGDQGKIEELVEKIWNSRA